MFGLEVDADAGADLRAYDAAHQQQDGKHHVNGVVGGGVQHGGEGGDEDDLKERCADDDLRWHAQEVDHRGDHDEAAADAHDRGEDANRDADKERRDHRNIKARDAELHLEGQVMDPVMLAPCGSAAGFCFAQGTQALDEHQAANDAEEHDIAEANEQIDLTERFEVVEKHHAEGGTYEAADQQDNAHSEIDGLSLKMREHAGKGRRDDLVCLGRHGNRGRDADEEQKRCHQEAAADAEHAGQNTHHAP